MIDKFYYWLAWALPRRVVYYAFIRVAAHASVGKFGSVIVSELTCFQAMERWEKPNVESNGTKDSTRGKPSLDSIPPIETTGYL